MVPQEASLVVDVGNSATRLAVIYTDNRGTTHTVGKALYNTFAVRDKSINISDEYTDDNTYLFNPVGRLPEMDGDFVDQYVGGLMARREYGAMSIRPTALDHKYDAITTLFTMNVAFAEGFRILSSELGVPIEELDVTWGVNVLLPPAELGVYTDENSGASKMSQLVRSIHEIDFSMPHIKKDIHIGKRGVTLLPEGYCAYIGVMFGPDKAPKQEYSEYLPGTVLVVDIGAGTTDFIVVKSGTAVEHTKFTENFGGNNIIQLARRVAKGSGFTISSDGVVGAMSTGYAMDGVNKVDMRPAITAAQSKGSSRLVNSLIDFLEENSFPVNEINHVLCVGGGASKPQVEGLKPISDYIVGALKRFSPNVGVIPISSGVSTRELNIMGAEILS